MAITHIDFSSILDNLEEGLYLVDRARRITYWNKAAERITGFRKEEVIGRRCSDNILIHVDCNGRELCLDGCPLAATIEDELIREANVFLHHKLGHRILVAVRATPLMDKDGQLIGASELFWDNRSQSDLQKQFAELESLAFVDALTGLVNRRYLNSELIGQLALWQRSGIPFGVLFFDIDHFKNFNDQYGHLVGDQALQTVARTLVSCVRPFDTIGRWGGEEFIGIFPNTEEKLLLDMATRFCMLVRKSQIVTAQGSPSLTISVGGTTPGDKDTLESLLQRADTMMYHSKQAGRDRVTIG